MHCVYDILVAFSEDFSVAKFTENIRPILLPFDEQLRDQRPPFLAVLVIEGFLRSPNDVMAKLDEVMTVKWRLERS